MKVSIITLHYINHYGSLLQTYATGKAFEKMNCDVEFVNYERPNSKESIQIKEAIKKKGYSNNFVKGFIFYFIKKIENIFRKNFSTKFLNKYVNFTHYYENYDKLSENPPIADVYVTGSDQTWNSDYNGGVLPAYYLRYAPKGKKRIGYAVSIGMPEFHDDEKDIIKQYASEYDAISVRENSAKKLLEGIGIDNVQQIIDPTLVLNLEDWKKIINPQRTIKEKYIIIYKLNNIPEIEEFAKKLSEETGAKIVRMSYYLNHFKYQGKMVFSPSVEEFLSLIYYADYVLTDSFHGLAFSLNFKKQFYVFYPGKYSTRLQSLLELTGTENRLIKNDLNYTKENIDYNEVDKILDIERNKAYKYIADCCEQ